MKLLIAMMIALFANTFAFSKENIKCIKTEIGCNNGCIKNVSAEKVADNDDLEMSPLKLLLFEI